MLLHDEESYCAERKEWVEPLRKWILDSKRAGFLVESTEYGEIRSFVKEFGTNPALKDKTISISFCPPSVFVSACKARGGFASVGAPCCGAILRGSSDL
jgi:hypothetical protein